VLLIPAIDLKGGQCVRLRQGKMDDATIFSSDPIAMAVHWRKRGARRLHIVDLDGAFAGKPKNGDLIRDMVAAMGSVPVQVGGGIRSIATIEAYIEAGVSAAIVGTKAIEDPSFLPSAATAFPQQVILGLDARSGKVATEGWDKTSSEDALDVAAAAAEHAIAGIVYTDIDRDGMMTGLNVEATATLAMHCGVAVIASGGVTSLEDLSALKTGFATCPDLLLGAITGRAIYEGTLDLAAGQALLDG